MTMNVEEEIISRHRFVSPNKHIMFCKCTLDQV